MQNYVAPNWLTALTNQSINNFDTLWALDADWFEPPNIRRGGWSGVSRIEVDIPNRGKLGLFLKRQENHRCKTWRHPISGIATLDKEFSNIIKFKKHNIPSLNPVYFAKQMVSGKLQAILITEELTGYRPLSDINISSPSNRKKLLQEVASVIHKMHAHNYQHNCLFPKHIFAKQDNGRWSVRIIDLEKTKHRISKKHVVLRDLGTLHRHATDRWTLSDRIILLRCYMGEAKLSNSSKKIAQIISKKTQSKNLKKEIAPSV